MEPNAEVGAAVDPKAELGAVDVDPKAEATDGAPNADTFEVGFWGVVVLAPNADGPEGVLPKAEVCCADPPVIPLPEPIAANAAFLLASACRTAPGLSDCHLCTAWSC